MLKVGDRAPEIDATGSDGVRFVLSAQQGLCTVVYFFPKAFTPGCTIETRRFRDNYAEIAMAGANIVGISTDDVDTQCRFASSLHAPFPMIGDHDLRICRAYGVLWPLIHIAHRATFIVGPDMIIQAVFRHEVRIKQHRDEVLVFLNEQFRSTRPTDPAPSFRAALRRGPPSGAARVEEHFILAAGTAPVPSDIATPAPSDSAAPAPSSYQDSGRRRSAWPIEMREAVAGRFELERLAASGAASHIYRALDRETGSAVAIKLLRDSPTRDNARFEREARILAELKHPGIVAYVAHGVEPDSGDAYLATEWLDGESLSQRLTREPPLTISEILTLGARVASALGAAHERAIVHRDITPSNLFLPGGQVQDVKLLDFGVSRSSSVSANLTLPGDVVGTPGYLSPEQARGWEITPRVDVFALGCVLFRCLTGRPAFEGKDMVALLLAVIKQEVPRARDVNPVISEPLSDLVARMLCKDPEGRPVDGHAVAAELVRVGASMQGAAHSALRR